MAGKRKTFKTKRIKAPKGYVVVDALKVSKKIAGVTFQKIIRPSKAPKYRKRR